MVHSVSDIDNENLNTTFTWTDSSGTILGTNPTLTLDKILRPVGSTITATVTTTDGYGGNDVAFDTITILNTEPTLTQAVPSAAHRPRKQQDY